ncbi:hypothetical protein BD408DRAFT_426340 [Parasitella parasitica]|nr:hypothetical protein BD408DRAFT_426340 [Parasitella parasitica]
MINMVTTSPTSPPSVARTQKEQEAADSLIDLQQRDSDPCDDNDDGVAKTIIDTSADPLYQCSPNSQDNASIKLEPSPEQSPTASRHGLILLPPINRPRESAVRSTLDRTLPVLDTLFREEDEIFYRQSALSASRHSHEHQHHRSRKNKRVERGSKSPKPNQYNQETHAPAQQLAHAPRRGRGHARVQSHVQFEAHAHAPTNAQIYHLSKAQAQAYGQPQLDQREPIFQHEMQTIKSSRSSQKKNRLKPPYQLPSMSHNVRGLEDHRNSQAWSEPSGSKIKSPSDHIDRKSLQNSFSIYEDGTRIRRTILNSRQQSPVSVSPTSSTSSSPRQNQMETMAHRGHRLIKSPSRQLSRQLPAQQQAVVLYQKSPR